MYYLGVDVGSVSINAAIINENGEVVYEAPYTRHFGIIYDKTYTVLENIFFKISHGRNLWNIIYRFKWKIDSRGFRCTI